MPTASRSSTPSSAPSGKAGPSGPPGDAPSGHPQRGAEVDATVESLAFGGALRRIGRLDGFELEPIVPAEQTWRYRNKLEYSFGTDTDGRLVCGFHAPGRFDVIEPVEDCLLASEAGNAARRRVLDWCRAEGLSAYDRREHAGLLRNLVVREGRRTGQLQVRLVTSPGDLRAARLAAAADVAGLWRTR